MSVVGSLLLLEHINLNVGDAGVAAQFYVDGLGGCADPARAVRRQSMHVNIGPFCQFHCASPAHEARIAEEGPQVWRGRITIAYREDELRAAVGRLQQLASGELAGTMCTVSPAPDGKSCEVTCPYGNRLLLAAATAAETEALAPSSGAGRPGSEASKALGFTCISLPCARGISDRIGNFYERCLGFACTRAQGRVEMWGGPNACQRLEFYETDAGIAPYTGDHFCFYLSDLKTWFERCRNSEVVWVNPRFIHLDETRTWEDCEKFKQFRFRHIVDDDGTVLYEQEHEVRMAAHGSYPLHQRVGDGASV